MPASPESNTICPSPDLALDQRRSSKSSSSSRPTRSVSPLACIASKRPSTNRPQRRPNSQGPEIPLSPVARDPQARKLPNSLRVPSATTTLFGSATPCRRAARFGVRRQLLAPEGTRPYQVADYHQSRRYPDTRLQGRVGLKITMASSVEPSAHGPLGIVLVGLG